MNKKNSAVKIWLTPCRVKIIARVNFVGFDDIKFCNVSAKKLVVEEMKRQFSAKNPYFHNWTGNYYDFEQRDGMRIKLSFELIETAQKPCVNFYLIDMNGVSCMLFFPTWRREKNKHIVMFTGDMRSKRRYTDVEFAHVACHEFGHAMGINDLYQGNAPYAFCKREAAPINPEMPANDIMRTSFANDWFTPNDLEMALLAYENNAPQTHFKLRFFKGLNYVSEAIKYK